MSSVRLTTVNTKKTIKEGSTLGQGEINDCVVLAIAAVTDLSYDQAHALVAEKLERKHRKGVRRLKLLDKLPSGTVLGQKTITEVFVPLNRYKLYGELIPRKMRLGTFVKKTPAGTYLILVRGHALALKDGVVHDNLNSAKLECLVQHVFKVE